MPEIDSEVSKCWCFRSEREHDNLIPRALSRGYASECITLEPFGNYETELCRFLIVQLVRVEAEEPISVNAKWASDTFAYRKPSQKHF